MMPIFFVITKLIFIDLNILIEQKEGHIDFALLIYFWSTVINLSALISFLNQFPRCWCFSFSIFPNAIRCPSFGDPTSLLCHSFLTPPSLLSHSFIPPSSLLHPSFATSSSLLCYIFTPSLSLLCHFYATSTPLLRLFDTLSLPLLRHSFATSS